MKIENEKAGKSDQSTDDERPGASSNPQSAIRNPQSKDPQSAIRYPQSKDSQSAIRNPLVVALDVASPDQALSLVERLRGVAGMFKVGKQLFTAAGPEIVRKIIAMGEHVFLDLKFHDIPNTVAMAGVEAARLGVSVFNRSEEPRL